MRNKGRRIATLVLSLSVAVASLSGCQSGPSASTPPKTSAAGAVSQNAGQSNVPDYLNATGFPIMKKPVTLTAFVNQNAAQPDWSEMLVWKEYEKKSGIHIDWQCIPADSVKEKRALALASGTLPDIFYRSSMSEAEKLKYGAQGYFVDLSKGLIDSYAPNLKALMDEFDDVRRGTPTADGEIYAFPALSNTWPVEANPKIFIDTKWLQKTEKQKPATTDEFYDLLKAFKSTDCNGDGKADEIPFSSTGINNVVRILRGAWGLGTRGFGNENFDIDESGDFRFIPSSDRYKEELEYLHKLYQEGLLDKEIFTISNKKLLAKNEKNLVGTFAFTNVGAVASDKYADDFEGLGLVLKGPHGDQIDAATRGHIASTTGMLITKNCKYPEAATRWVDYFYGEEGAELLYSGIEGQTYKKNSDGRCELLPAYTTVPEGSSFDQIFSKVSPWAGGGLPACSNVKSFQGAEIQSSAIKEADALKAYAPKELWGPFSFTMEENQRKAELESDLNNYISQKQAEFIQGKTPLSSFDSYVSELKKMGLDEYVQLYKTAYSRYEKK